jgi:hypothetical protein
MGDHRFDDLWPAHLKPMEDELLSSWLFRLSVAHGLDPVSFSTTVWPKKKTTFYARLDEKEDDEVLGLLAKKTGTPLNRVQAIPLGAYEGRLYLKDECNGDNAPWLSNYAPWILPAANQSVKGLFSLQFCSACLQEAPYFRRKWRLALMTFCEKHHVLLYDRCPWCQQPVNLQSARLLAKCKLSKDSIVHCLSCDQDYRLAVPSVHQLAVTEDEIEAQVSWLNAIKHGWIEIPVAGPVYSNMYFPVLHKLIRILTRGPDAYVLREAVCKHYGVPLVTLSFPGSIRPSKLFSSVDYRHKFFELLNVDERRGLLRMIRCLLGDWPYGFIEFCKANLSYLHGAIFEDFDSTLLWEGPLLEGMEHIPFWYWSVVHDHLIEHVYRHQGHEKERLYQSRVIVEYTVDGWDESTGLIITTTKRPFTYRPREHYYRKSIWKSEELQLYEDQIRRKPVN